MRRHLRHIGIVASAVALVALVVLTCRSYRTPDQFTYTSENAVYGVEFQREFVCVARLPAFFTGYRRGFGWVTFASPATTSRPPAWLGSFDRHSVTLPVGGLLVVGGTALIASAVLVRRYRGRLRLGFEVGPKRTPPPDDSPPGGPARSGNV